MPTRSSEGQRANRAIRLGSAAISAKVRRTPTSARHRLLSHCYDPGRPNRCASAILCSTLLPSCRQSPIATN